jgi:hypothetical protein
MDKRIAHKNLSVNCRDIPLIEAEAVWMREDETDGSAQEYEDFFRQRYGVSERKDGRQRNKGVAQLANSIRHLANGGWAPDSGIHFSKKIVPVLLVHDPLIDTPSHPWFLAREFAALLDPTIVNWDGEPIQVGRFAVSNLIVMTLDFLEVLESIGRNISLADLLRDYSESSPNRMLTLHNFVASDPRYRDIVVSNNRIRIKFNEEVKTMQERLAQST